MLPKESHDEKRCEIKGGSQEMAVMVQYANSKKI